MVLALANRKDSPVLVSNLLRSPGARVSSTQSSLRVGMNGVICGRLGDLLSHDVERFERLHELGKFIGAAGTTMVQTVFYQTADRMVEPCSEDNGKSPQVWMPCKIMVHIDRRRQAHSLSEKLISISDRDSGA